MLRSVLNISRNRGLVRSAISNFPHFRGTNLGVLTERSYDVLHDLLAPYAEFLPLTSTHGRFIAFKVLKIVDALDRERSNIEWVPQLKKDVGKPRTASQIRKFAFYEREKFRQKRLRRRKSL